MKKEYWVGVGKRLLNCLFPLLLVLIGVSFVLRALLTAIVWIVTIFLEICLLPLYFVIWIFSGKFHFDSIHTKSLEWLTKYGIIKDV